VPGLHQVDTWDPSTGSAAGGKHAIWWTSIQPTSDFDWALVAQSIASPLPLNVATNAVRQNISGPGDKSVPSTGLGLNRTWSQYDSLKLQLGHQVLESIASILRTSSLMSASHQSFSGEFDIGTIVEVFCCCAELSTTKRYPVGEQVDSSDMANRGPRAGDGKTALGNGENWLTSTNPVTFSRVGGGASTGFGLAAVASLAARTAGLYSANPTDDSADTGTGLNNKEGLEEKGKLQPTSVDQDAASSSKGVASIDKTLSFVTENLICAIYSISLNMTSKELAEKSTDLQACLRICEEFPPHSFISEVGRWLGKLI
jgi:hypothetical protein